MNDEIEYWRKMERDDCRFNLVIAGTLVVGLLWLFVVVVNLVGDVL